MTDEELERSIGELGGLPEAPRLIPYGHQKPPGRAPCDAQPGCERDRVNLCACQAAFSRRRSSSPSDPMTRAKTLPRLFGSISGTGEGEPPETVKVAP